MLSSSACRIIRIFPPPSPLSVPANISSAKTTDLERRRDAILREAAEEQGLIYFFSRQFRFTHTMRRAHELIARQGLEKINLAEAVRLRSRGIPTGLGGWFTATVRLNPLTLFQDVGGKLVDQALEPPDRAESIELRMQTFVDAIAGRAAPVNSAKQAVYLMEMLDAIYLSSSTGREVQIAQA
ncbi:MAG: hypothetical protein ABI787_11965 [Spartobacteria bacterium]